MAVTSGTVRLLLHACAFAAPLLASGVALAQQAVIGADEDTSAVAFRNQAGKVVTFVCPAISRYREIWGTGIYSYASPICTTAVHASALKPRTPGQVTIKIGAATREFRGSVRNGVTSQSYGPADTTYSFVSNSEPGQIDWHTSYDRVPDGFQTPITVVCPADAAPASFGGLIGTDVYRSDSAICVAAVHAGVITPRAGGLVTITVRPKQEALPGSTRNGVSSQSWEDWNYAAYPQPYTVTSGAPATVAGSAPDSAPAARNPRQTQPAPTPPDNPTPLERSPRSGTPTVLSGGPAPENLAASGTPGLATLTWHPVAGATGYHVLRAPAGTAIGGTAWTQLTPNPIAATTLMDELPNPLAGYTYQVVAYQPNGSFGAATVSFVAPPPQVPTDLEATVFPPAEVRLKWKAVAHATEYRISGPGFVADAKTSGTSVALPNAPSGLNTYRVAAVYPPGKVLTAAADWSSAALAVPPIPTVRQLTLPNGEGNLIEYNRHACAAGTWIAGKIALPNSWCSPVGRRGFEQAPVTLLPILNVLAVDQWENWDFRPEPITALTAFEDPWIQFGRVLRSARFADLAHLNRNRSVDCIARGAPINATVCWAMSLGGDLRDERRATLPHAGILHSVSRGNNYSDRKWTVILQTTEGSYFLAFSSADRHETNSDRSPSNVSAARTALDYEGGLRYLPHACLSCHGGTYNPSTGAVVGASLLPLDQRDFETITGWDPERVRELNAIIFASNSAPAVRDYINDMYRGQQLVPGAAVHDDVPPGWTEQPGLYRQIYRPYCASCHLTQEGPLGIRSWNDLYRERARVQRSVCQGTMPHAEVPFWRFWTEGGAASLPGVLLASLGYDGC